MGWRDLASSNKEMSAQTRSVKEVEPQRCRSGETDEGSEKTLTLSRQGLLAYRQHRHSATRVDPMLQASKGQTEFATSRMTY
ncbi:hypothetical protein BIW11_03883 [Tropilaelaps mercedesae]|uniref:Uncharacterized protein n=1 Tax=Tropilaelaps mercedesae TaxID=418985 RepID=A0A1V9XEB9_9ACAR|nr:hypothetical protein BIW11_03883 [Tropilaelaps mercedesae]